MHPRVRTAATVVLAVALLLGWYLVSRQDDTRVDDAARPSRLGTVATSDLPREARRTLVLMDRGGPFPYERDGIVFGNREGLLPRHPSGWYREFTVPTPGESDRGARRIVTGRDQARFWSPDHYRSFSRITGYGP